MVRGSAEDDEDDAAGTAEAAAAAKADAAAVDIEPETTGDELEEKVEVGQSGAKRREGECCELGDLLLRLREAIETDDVPLPAVVEAGERSSGEGRFLLLKEVEVAAFMVTGGWLRLSKERVC